jgi:hypothetical protein
MVAEVMTTHHLSQRRACGLIGITRRTFRRAPGEDRNRLLRQRLRELAEERRRWGCPLLYQLLRREGFKANHKRVERLYREEGLSLCLTSIILADRIGSRFLLLRRCRLPHVNCYPAAELRGGGGDGEATEHGDAA